MDAAIEKRADAVASDLRSQFREERIRHAGITRNGTSLEIAFRSQEERDKARDLLRNTHNDLSLDDRDDGQMYRLVATMTDASLREVRDYALKQNISTLHNRLIDLGVAEHVTASQ